MFVLLVLWSPLPPHCGSQIVLIPGRCLGNHQSWTQEATWGLLGSGGGFLLEMASGEVTVGLTLTLSVGGLAVWVERQRDQLTEEEGRRMSLENRMQLVGC